MKTLYALVFVCLSLPAFADVLDITPTGVDEEYTAATSGLAAQPTEDRSVGGDVDVYVDEYNAGAVAPATQPIDATEFQPSSRDDDTMFADDDYTAGVTAPAAPTIEDTPVNPGLDSLDEEVQEFKLPATIGEPWIEFVDWA
jgi:hypothetical protein